MRKILLNKSKSKERINNDNNISISFDRDISLFNNEVLSETIDVLQQYNNEKNNSNKHRFIFTLTPICTNSLFNYLTEIIYKEGSNDCELITDKKNYKTSGNPISKEPLNRTQAIRNTEYSNDEFNLNYHCGVDMFNNHLFRSDKFISIQKIKDENECDVYDDYSDNTPSRTIKSFNTIGDYRRNSDGNKCKIPFPNSNDYTYSRMVERDEPLYIYDDIKNFRKTYLDSLKRKDGWMGFYNKTTMSIPVNNSGKDYYVNKIINNVESCKFIDLSPERDLFLFTPKKNEYRKRVEHNWDYCLTYPSESIYEDDYILKGKGKGLPLIPFEDGLFYKNNNSSAGTDYITFRSATKHNLVVGDFINLKYKTNDKDEYSDVKCKIYQTGNEDNKFKDRYFSILKGDLIGFIPLEYYKWDISDNKYKFYSDNKPSDSYNQNTLMVDNIPTENIEDYDYLTIFKNIESFRFAKIVNGFECEYYFRKFKKIGNSLNKTINRLAFSNSIYGEEVAQLIFLDDIDISAYKDNRNCPLTEIYLTIIKRNKGYREWYQEEDYTNENIEYSRVFGEITSGLDLPPYAKSNLPTIRYQHNINNWIGGYKVEYLPENKLDYNYILYNKECYIWDEVNNKYIIDTNTEDGKKFINESSPKIETEITIDNNEFYGDLVEFNPININETVLEVIKHRFNTAQRESDNDLYNTIKYDEIYGDIYDFAPGETSKNSRIVEMKLNEGFANLNTEGYIYIPHHKIKIGEFSNIVKQGNDSSIEISELTNINEYYKWDNNTNKYILLDAKPDDIENIETVEIIPETKLNDYDYIVINNKISFKTSINNKLLVFDEISAQLKTENEFKYYIFKVFSSKMTDDGKYLHCKAEIINKKSYSIEDICNKNNIWFKHNINIPDYAYILPDATGRHIWKDIVLPSDYAYDSDLYKIPFTNGAFYHHTNIMLPIRRQDPFKLYDTYIWSMENNERKILNNNFDISATELDISDIEYIQETQTSCF